MAGGDLESFVSWVVKQDFAKTGWGWAALRQHPSTASSTGGEVLPYPQTGKGRVFPTPPDPNSTWLTSLPKCIFGKECGCCHFQNWCSSWPVMIQICVCFSQLPYCWPMLKTHDISPACHVFPLPRMTKRSEMSCISLPAHNHKRNKKKPILTRGWNGSIIFRQCMIF